jgi:hypothetical protein
MCRAHPVEHVLVRDDLHAVRGSLARSVHQLDFARRSAAGLGELLVATDVIAVHMRVDDVTDRLIRQGPDGGHNFVRERRVLGVHYQHAGLADLQRDVAACAHQHVDVALHGQDVHFDVVQVLVLWGAVRRRCNGIGFVRWRAHSLPVFRIHRLRSAQNGGSRHLELVREFVEEWILARKITRHFALGPRGDLFHGLARPQPATLRFVVEGKIVRTH